jgi:hypothetical protein
VSRAARQKTDFFVAGRGSKPVGASQSVHLPNSKRPLVERRRHKD